VVDWQRQAWPIAWSSVFGREAPLALEIGFGNGAFLAEQARLHPERDHVGLEISWTAATYLFRRLDQGGLGNVRVLLGDAEAFVRRHFAPAALAAVFVNHPCPWPKARHVERRLLGRAFLAELAERMLPGAPLTMVTDHAEYAAWLTEELAAQDALVSRHATPTVSALAGRTPTKYERKALAQGLPIHYFEWRRADGPAPRPHAAPAAEASMPTITLSGEAPVEELFAGFRPQVFRETAAGVEVLVKLEAVYRRVDRPLWLVEVLAQEDQLRQHFGVDVLARHGEWLIKLSDLGLPYPTHAVKRAVWCVARWLMSRHAQLAVRHQNVGDAVVAVGAPWPSE